MKTIKITKIISHFLILLMILASQSLIGQTLVTHDFNNGNFAPYEVNKADQESRVYISNDAVETHWQENLYNGTNSGRKAQIRPVNDIIFTQHIWMGFRIKIHSDYMAQNTNTNAGLMQIWGYNGQSGAANHMCMLKFDGRNGGALVWQHRYNSVDSKAHYLVQGNFPRNQFVDVVVHVQLKNQDDGIVQVWVDGELKLNKTGETIGWGDQNENGMYNGTYAFGTSIGQYNFFENAAYDDAYDGDDHWFDGHLAGETRTVTYDNVSLYNGANGYDQVDPSLNGDGGNNLALNKSASQSSTGSGGVAARATDGNTNGAWSGGSVTHTTANTSNPWWEVDLGGTYDIDDIVLFNRTDNCCKARLSNFTVSVIDGNSTTFSQTFSSSPDPSISVDAGGATGDVVRVQINGTGTLSLAEVEVYGTTSSNTSGGGDFQLVKRNATGFVIDGGGNNGAEGRSIELYSYVQHNNLTWTEISRGGGYYSYQKRNSNVCFDGGDGGGNGQDVTLETCNANDQNQHWLKIDEGNGHYRLEKRGTNFSLDGGSGGAIDQNVYLWTSTNTQNQHWRFDSTNSSKQAVANEVNLEQISANEIISVEENIPSELNFYPNPLSNKLNVDFPANTYTQYSMYDVIGKLILQKSIEPNTNAIEIDFQNLNNGVYIINLNGQKSNKSVKIIKD